MSLLADVLKIAAPAAKPYTLLATSTTEREIVLGVAAPLHPRESGPILARVAEALRVSGYWASRSRTRLHVLRTNPHRAEGPPDFICRGGR